MRLEIVAEVGVNHNGSVDTARKLVDAAVEARCDCVKFQVFRAKDGYTGAKRARIEKLELSEKDFAILKNHCDDVGIEFFATPDSFKDVLFLRALGVKRMKSSSQDITNVSFLEEMAKRVPDLVVSTGASTMWEVCRAFEAVRGLVDCLTLLHCVSAYPAPVEQMNLRAITTMKTLFPSARVGLSDHTMGYECGIAAVALGATMIEKHLTLDTKMGGPDHAASFEPHQMKIFVRQLRDTYRALGDGRKQVMPCERDARVNFEKFLATRKARGAC